MITQQHVEEMVRHARNEFPNEACGLLAAKDGRVTHVYPIRNTDASPTHYNMDSQEQLRAMLEMDDLGCQLGGIFHSHTRTQAYPSPTDVRLAFYPDVSYLIVSLADDDSPEVRSFRIEGGEIIEEELEVLAE